MLDDIQRLRNSRILEQHSHEIIVAVPSDEDFKEPVRFAQASGPITERKVGHENE